MDLFPDAYADSPRLRWMRRWGVSVRKDGSRYVAEIGDDFPAGRGATADEAIDDLVAEAGIPHYKEPIL